MGAFSYQFKVFDLINVTSSFGHRNREITTHGDHNRPEFIISTCKALMKLQLQKTLSTFDTVQYSLYNNICIYICLYIYIYIYIYVHAV